MPSDRYTRAVLTVIALALVGMLVAQTTTPAQAQLARTCSGTEMDPCWVKITN